MVGSAVATLVWLRAARKTVSMRPTNIVRASDGVSVFGAGNVSADGAPAHLMPDASWRARDVSVDFGGLRFTLQALSRPHHRPAGRRFKWPWVRGWYEEIRGQIGPVSL